jgi:NAD(P)H-nitrite reductase large subunit
VKYVIIGNSAAAVGAVEGLRSVDPEGAITLVSNETYHTYSRPLISYLLQGRTDRQRMKYRPDDFYETNGCRTLFGRTAVKLEPEKRSVLLDDGTALTYDSLLVAAGSSPFVPPMAGLESVEKHFSFMSLDDANALEQALFPEARVLIVGAGLIGLKCAEGIFGRVGKITVLDLAAHVLPSILDEAGAALVQRALESKGVDFRPGVSVKRFSGGSAELADGQALAFDILVTAVGVRPNAALVRDAGGETDGGILVDDKMRTTLCGVYAAGDCVLSHDLSCGSARILAILPNAYSGGFAAGTAMAGGEPAPRRTLPMNAIGLFGLHIATAGSYTGEVYQAQDAESYKKLFYSGGVLRGYILIGDVDRAGIYTALIREQTPLSQIDFPAVCREPSLIAFGRAYRDEKLAGKKD